MASLVVIVIPLPTAIMDLLLAANIALAAVILLATIHVKTPLELSVFPTLLLATTLARLVLNIATTRLILTGAPTLGDRAAGGVVETFGRLVAGNQIEVGLVLFLILVIVQFVVITKGATRISEVAARFALDGMPGRQSAIDADLNSGHIDAATASQKRDDLIAEADFYAAMDGASKFVRGDAIAGLAITAINILGGLYLGVFVFGMNFSQASGVFTKLTIGDGLVSQLPSLLLSLAAGVLVTRGTRPTDLADNATRQIFSSSRALFIASGFLIVLTFSGLPVLPLLFLGAGALLIASSLHRDERREEQERAAAASASNESVTQKRVEDFLAVDPLEVSIGLGLLPLADPARGGDLMQRISSLRNQMAAQIGIVLPKVRVRDDATLGEHEYEIRIHGDFIARRQLKLGKLLAIDGGRTTGIVSGERAEDYFPGVAASWIAPESREQALIFGYKTQTTSDVMAEHLEHVVRAHADELLSRDATRHLLDELEQIAPAMVRELVPDIMKVADVQKVLQGLLQEAIPIRQLGIILEALSDAAMLSSDTEFHIEYVRGRLARTLCAGLRDSQGVLNVISLDRQAARELSQSEMNSDGGATNRANCKDVTCDAIRRAVKKQIEQGYPPVLLVAPELRRRVKQATLRADLHIHVLSSAEITSDTPTKTVATIAAPSPSAAA